MPPDASSDPPSDAAPALWSPLWPLVLLGALTALPEVLFLGADAGLWGSGIWRVLAYQYGGFWAGLWHGWQPNYAAQPYVMMVSYSVLHAGVGHLAGNLAGLWLVGVHLAPRLGTGAVLALWGAGILGGAVAFGLLATTAAPVVGASGAVFGLVGGWWVAELRAGWRGGLRSGGVLLALAFGNAAVTWATPGGIAWETHLGGFLGGAALAALWRR